MKSRIIDKRLQKFRLRLDETIKNLHNLTQNIQSKELSNTVSELRQRINEPYMFVVVGEVKAGKSSFVNALLETEKDICKVAPDPCTDTVQQILYGEEEQIMVMNPHLKKILLPVEILKEIAIVDTPGTNAISEGHQKITEDFIPSSDLIVFVFEAKNPYRQSSWDFFDFIHKDWRKKIIFVLQQSDLLNESDLNTNIEGVRKHAEKKGLLEPQIFAVSAKLEKEGNHEESHFAGIREYIKDNITGGRAPLLKLKNNIDTSKTILSRIKEGVNLREKQLQADNKFRLDVKKTLNDQEKKSLYQVDVLIENILGAYENITRETEQEISKGLNPFNLLGKSFKSMLSDKESVKMWFERVAQNLERNLTKTLTDKLGEGITAIADTIQQMAKMIDLQLNNSPKILKENHVIFGDIADRRSRVLQDLQTEFHEFTKETENFVQRDLFPKETSFATDFAAGGGLAIVGVALTVLTQGAVFDITGGIITTVGLLFTGVTVMVKKQKIMQKYREQIAQGKQALKEEIYLKLSTYIANLKNQIDANFKDFDLLMEMEDKQILELKNQYEAIDRELEKILDELI
ncbi:putative GTPase [Bernardetia litoralis DSM 6794]|uniref:Putative GTPase n=1 Tax=Bernardetia litoralis (strain ATCC 23117 / DSM 6794 / NBRC 15988 / NCIMB 1366 / Fx l1 / Sio-4) TaxID=880071 RepID=I4AQS4_BERLS|nr:dynamin family protein [Bernardetia litoralis]AFM06309.1 putative GTPase [Bernardetia litoralis DSM 6794]